MYKSIEEQRLITQNENKLKQFKVEFPTRSGNYLNLKEVAFQLNAQLQKIFTADQNGARPAYGRHNDF